VRLLVSLLSLLLLGVGCLDTGPDDDDTTTDDDDVLGDDDAGDDDAGDDDAGDDDVGDDDAGDDDAGDDDAGDDDAGDDDAGDDDAGDDDTAGSPPRRLLTGASGRVLTSPTYRLELFVGSPEPIGSTSSTGYVLHLGPGAVRSR
jgi:hypothetical protein